MRSLTTHLSASYYGLYWVPMLTLRSIRETGSQRWLLAPRLVAALSFAGFGSFFGVDIPSGQKLWSFAGDGDLTSAPLIVNQITYIGSPFAIEVISLAEWGLPVRSLKACTRLHAG